MKHINWNLKRIEKYLEDKYKRRGVEALEYSILIKNLAEINPEVLVDVGCFYGVSTYILGTSISDLKYLYAIENIDDKSFCEYIIDEIPIPKADYAKFAPKETIFKTHGYEKDLPPILHKHKDNLVFVFLDAKKNSLGVLDELSICYNNKVKYVGLHDTSKYYKNPRRAMKKSIKLDWYELIEEINVERIKEKSKGVSILRLKE